MDDVRAHDRRPEDFFLGLAEGDAVFFYISVEKEKAYNKFREAKNGKVFKLCFLRFPPHAY